MHTYDLAQRLIQRFGKLLGLDTLTLEGGSHSCALEFDGTIAVTFEFHEASGHLALTSLLGAIPVSGAEALLRTLMAANFGDYLASGGAALGLEPQSRELVLMQSRSVSELDDAGFEKLVEQFVNRAELWKQRIAEILSGGPLPAPEQGPQAPLAQAEDGTAAGQRPHDGAHIYG